MNLRELKDEQIRDRKTERRNDKKRSRGNDKKTESQKDIKSVSEGLMVKINDIINWNLKMNYNKYSHQL